MCWEATSLFAQHEVCLNEGRSLLSAHQNRKATPDDSCLSPIRLCGREEKHLHISKDCTTFAAVFEVISHKDIYYNNV